jgi:16S rRNA (uracil1498-N3)-methyltransferase
MRKHRFYVAYPLALQSTIELDEDVSHYISRVLRLKNSDQIYLFNNSGSEYLAEITNMKKDHIAVKICESSADQNESPLQIILAQVIGKGEKMDLVIQKATELGVHSIVPLYSAHAVVKNTNKLAHWQKVAIAASCQSGRNYVPEIHQPQLFSEWLPTVRTAHKLILDPNTAAQNIKTLSINAAVTILIGPEGGFSANELTQAQQHNFTAITLGPRILRTETAGIATIAILQNLFGDL